MRALLQAIGSVIFVMWLAGSLGFIDFQLCAKPVGQCNLKGNP